MDEIKHREQVELIREVFHYQSRFDGKTIVLKIDYPILGEPHFPLLMKDLALLRSTGIEIVLVPGSKEWIDAVLAEYDITSDFVDGVRLSTAESIPFIRMAAFDVATRLMTQLSGFGANAVVGNFVRARGRGVVGGIDFEHSGVVDKILVEPLQHLLNQGMIPIFPCIGWNAAGKPYNLSSDEIALAVCEALQAEKLFFVTPSDGFTNQRYTLPSGLVLTGDGRVARLSLDEADEVLKLNPLEGLANSQTVELRYLKMSLQACRKGCERAHIIDGRMEGSVLREIFSNLGIGTMVYDSDYEAIRSMQVEDISEVLNLMQPLVDKGILVPRSEETIANSLADYVVYEIDGVVHACGALHVFDDQAEIAAIATNPTYAHLNMGRKILGFLIDKAHRLRLTRVFALTTRTLDWFEQLGFTETDLASLPPARQATYNHKRKSRIFALELSRAHEGPER